MLYHMYESVGIIVPSCHTGDKDVDRIAMATLYRNLQEYRPEEENISTYLDRVELFFVANEIQAAKQVLIFLNVVGATTFRLLRSLLAPDEPKTKSMADLAAGAF